MGEDDRESEQRMLAELRDIAEGHCRWIVVDAAAVSSTCFDK